MQTTRWLADDNKVHPKRPEKGGRRCVYPKQRNEAIDSPTPRIEDGAAEKRDQDYTGRRRHQPKGRQNKSVPMLKENAGTQTEG